MSEPTGGSSDPGRDPGPDYAPPPTSYAPPPGSFGYGPAPAYGNPPVPRSGALAPDDTIWAMLSHLSLFVLSLIGPLVIYLIKRDTSPFVRQHAAEALNFHISLFIFGVVSVLLIFVLVGIFTTIALGIYAVVATILAAVAAGRGQPYRYPLSIRFVR